MVAAPFICRRIIANRHNPRAGNRQRAGLRLGIIQSDDITVMQNNIRCRAGGGGCACGREQKRSAVLESRGGTRLIISMFLLSGDKQTIESEQELFNLCPGTVRSVFRTVVMKKKSPPKRRA